jgi:nucleoside 2-deoxyribosyltransferase-like protein
VNVYVAAPYVNRSGAHAVAHVLRAEEFTVVSSWHELPEETDLEAAAVVDLQDLDRADMMLHLDIPSACSAGRWVETGYAIARGLPVVVVQTADHPKPGPDGCIFLALPGVRVADGLAEAIRWLRKARGRRHRAVTHNRLEHKYT